MLRADKSFEKVAVLRGAFKEEIDMDIDIHVDIDVDMDIDIDMAVSMTLGVPSKGLA